MPRRPSNGTRFPGNMRTSSTSTIMPRHTIWIGIASPCSTVTQRPSFRWVLSRGKSCGSNCAPDATERVNSKLTMSTSPSTLSLSLLLAFSSSSASMQPAYWPNYRDQPTSVAAAAYINATDDRHASANVAAAARQSVEGTSQSSYDTPTYSSPGGLRAFPEAYSSTGKLSTCLPDRSIIATCC